MKKKTAQEIVIFLTGGTIAMRSSPLGAIPADDLEESLALALASAGVSLRFVPWASKPSPHMTPQDMFQLAHALGQELEKDTVHGAIVLHGTDLLAETAFVIDRVLVSQKPVVCSGSMRHMEENGYDGIRNVANSVIACLNMPRASEVLVQMADFLYTATDAVKVDSMSVASFAGMARGAVGRIVNDNVAFTQNITVRRPRLPFIVTGIGGRVPLIACYPGITSEDIFWPCANFLGDVPRCQSGATPSSSSAYTASEGTHGTCGEVSNAPSGAAIDEAGFSPATKKTFLSGMRLPDGVVLEALGAGNVPPGLLDFIAILLDGNIPVILASRVPQGGVMPLYGYPGGGGDLLSKGVLSARALPATKAQLLLKMALASGCSTEQLRELFPV